LVIVIGIVAANSRSDMAGDCPCPSSSDADQRHLFPPRADDADTHGRFSPGLFTAMVLFFPVATACYWRAAMDGSLDVGTLIGSLGLGALLMASPVGEGARLRTAHR